MNERVRVERREPNEKHQDHRYGWIVVGDLGSIWLGCRSEAFLQALEDALDGGQDHSHSICEEQISDIRTLAEESVADAYRRGAAARQAELVTELRDYATRPATRQVQIELERAADFLASLPLVEGEVEG